MISNEAFEKSYKELNVEQKDAVDTIEGPVMVVAGPGTGKTQILTLRIANILNKTDTEPENILALTFTESGAVAMRRRLVEIIGSDAYYVSINTFHGFCNDIIKNYPEEFPYIIGSQNITEPDQIKILEPIIEKSKLTELKPFGDTFHYLHAILSDINKLKQEGVNVDMFENIVKQEFEVFNRNEDLYYEKGQHAGKMKGKHQKTLKEIKKNEELVLIYREYQKELIKKKFYDYSDMIVEVFDALKRNDNFLLALQEQYQYILVDEHQDTNNAQNKILELLCGFYENPNIFVVGDEKQAIFRFQGASLENFLYFKKLYPEAKLVRLKQNYRSTQSILNSAHSLINGEVELISNSRNDGRKISIYQLSSHEVECLFLADEIKKRISDGISPNEIAVLYRDNKDAFSIADIFEKRKIPFVIESEQNVLEDEEIKKLLLLFRAINNFGSDDILFDAMHINFLGILPIDTYKLIDARNKEKKSIYYVLNSLDELKNLSLESPEVVYDFYKKLSKWKISSKNKNIVSFFEELVRESGFLSHILGLPDSSEKMSKLMRFFDEVKTLSEAHRDIDINDFLHYVDILSNHRIEIKKSGSQHITSRVRCMTAHRAKGLEFECVFITGVYDGHWGNRRRYDLLPLPTKIYSLFETGFSQNENDDERRLFYVALTRAKKEVLISYPRFDFNGRERLPSQFISEIDEKFKETSDVSVFEESYKNDKEIIFSNPLVSGIPVKNKEFINELFLRNGLSVTGLNNYLECPWRYFYTNLLRIPKAKSKHQMYGIAIHAALNDFFVNIKKRDVGKDFLIKKFEFYLNREPFLEHEFDESLKKGTASLGGYYDNYVGKWNTNTLTEFDISGIMLSKNIRITGKIDKLEILNERGDVNVVDYKTGSIKSRSEIEGLSKKEISDDSDGIGNIKRQLIFYKLLLGLYKDGKKFKMVSGDIDFIEPDKKGGYKKERFEITEEEVENLKNLVTRVSNEILNLSFWDSFCDDEKCEFCELRRMMK